MSVNTNQYIILGVKIPYLIDREGSLYDKVREYDDNGYKPVHRKDGLTAILDGMNGNYIFIGKVIVRSDVNESIDGPIELSYNQEIADLLSQLIKEKFGIKEEVKLWFVTHYH